MRLHARSRGLVHAQNRQQMRKVRAWHRHGVTRQLPGTLAAPRWVIRRRRDKPGFRLHRIGLERFLAYARVDRYTIAILKTEAAARAYCERLRVLARAGVLDDLPRVRSRCGLFSSRSQPRSAAETF